jgi:hypothetical protein
MRPISGGAEMINPPHFLRVDVKDKTISSQKGDTQRATPIDNMHEAIGNLILRGDAAKAKDCGTYLKAADKIKQ